jgi:hypothetical protein
MKNYCRIGWALAALGFFLIATVSRAGAANAEQEFDTLAIGTQTYSNVTVTTKNKNYVFLLHSTGMVNVKVTDLSEEEKALLGYPSKLKPATNAAVAWAKDTLKKMDTPKAKALEKLPVHPQDFSKLMDPRSSLPALGVPIIAGIIAFLFIFYFFMCYCAMLICKKAGSEPGALIWIPILQMVPMFRAAGMSPVWFIASLLPILNVIAHIVWSVRIAKARGKTVLTAICLILPITNFFAFLYLAFSNGEEQDKDERSEVMTLGAARQPS